MSAPVFYKNDNDVHIYTEEYRQKLKERFADYALFQSKVSPSLWEQTMTAIKEMFPGNATIEGVVRKYQGRYNEEIGGYRDNDISVNVAATIVQLHNLVVRKGDDSITRLYQQILEDIGQTCIQGDSFRTISLWIALQEDMGC